MSDISDDDSSLNLSYNYEVTPKKKPKRCECVQITTVLGTILSSGVLSIVFLFFMLFILWTKFPFEKCDRIEFKFVNNNTKIMQFKDSDFGGLAINQLQLLGTHNSYHIQPIIPFSSTFRYSHEPIPNQLERGVRHLEIDCHFNRRTNRWVVYHIAILDSSVNCGDCLRDCLLQVKNWSDKNNYHTVLVIYIEPKTIFNAHPFCVGNDDYIFLHLESEVLSVFPIDQIIIPLQIQGNYSTLSEAVQKRGWPSVQSTRGKALFVLNFWKENGHCREYYEKKHSPLFFMRTNDDHVDSVFVEMGSIGNKATITKYLKKNYFVRTGVGVTESSIQASVDYGAQLLATDEYFSYLPMQTRCNPVLTKNCSILNP